MNSNSSNQNKEYEDFKETRPMQLDMFFNTTLNPKSLSNTVELYDTMPKYHHGKQKRMETPEGAFLPSVEKEFEIKNTKYKVTISPGRVTRNGKDFYSYPSRREELIEDVLRKFASEGRGVYLDDNASVSFSLYELQKELQSYGHGYNLNELKEGLQINNTCNVKITSEDGEMSISAPIFTTLGLSTRGNNKRAFVRFHPLVTKAIDEKKHRVLNFVKYMEHKKVLTRWLHKRLSHYFVQAGDKKNYHLKLSTIVSGSGMSPKNSIGESRRQIEQTLSELVENNVLAVYNPKHHCDVQKKGSHANKITDIVFTMIPHKDFIQDIKKANAKARVIGFREDFLDPFDR